MQMSHFSTDLMDPTRFLKPNLSPESDDRLAASAAPVSPYDKESLFEKPLTPSDVGKLNRLVIPKQYAEKYFPLGGCGGSIEAAGGLLGFEDESGKSWRFRYSYWNSSQSYVLTKGWSRYVKDKNLDAGDVVFFERHRSDTDRLFIGWRRRGAPPPHQLPPFRYNGVGVGLGIHQFQSRGGNSGGGAVQPEQEHAPPGNSTRLVRLFGVNLECQSNPEPSFQTTSFQSYSHPIQSQHQQEAFRNYLNYMGHHPQQMEMDLTQGVNQMGNGIG